MKEKLKQLLQIFRPTEKERGPSNRLRYLIIIALIGLLLIIVSNAFTPKKKEPDSALNIEREEATEETVSKEESVDSMVSDLEGSYEKDLVEMLENIKGVSDVKVMINLDSTNIKVYEKNLIKGKQTTDELDKNGGERKVEDNTEETEVVFVRQGDQEVPLLIQTKKPEVRGVFVVAHGVDHAAVKMWVIESVAKVLDVPTHKVSVMPKK